MCAIPSVGCHANNRRLAIAPLARSFSGIVPDLAVADKQQVELFAAIGDTKGLFRGVINWPYLNEVIRKESAELLQHKGDEIWKEQGGCYDREGSPTFLPRAQIAVQSVRRVATSKGGFIWTDAQGIGWAVSLVPVSSQEDDRICGLAISWGGAGRIVDPLVREEYRRVVEEQMAQLDGSDAEKHRERLHQLGEQLRLYERAEQLLWVIHSAVLAQRKSLVLIPDILLGEVIWGANRASWPDNWRNNIADTLWSLSRLYAATMQLSRHGWQPQFNMRSAAVAHVEHLESARKQRGLCRNCCPLWNKSERHGHFLIQIGYGFLGMLELCAINDNENGDRQFNFRTLAKRDGRKQLKTKAGRIVQVHLPTKLFGPSDWTALRPGPRRIIQALVGEVTRSLDKKDKSRPDHAEIVVGSRVPGAFAAGNVQCPYLHPLERYVAFNGNGHRRGKGYRLEGHKGKGWLFKAGYAPPGEAYRRRKELVTFLEDLADVADVLGLVVVGFDPRTSEWLDLATMFTMAHSPTGWSNLNRLHMRIYGPEDYLDRIRTTLAGRGGFACIPGTRLEKPEHSSALLGDLNLNLLVRVQQAGISQRELARELGCSQQFISALFRGKKAWPEPMRVRVERYVEQSASAVSRPSSAGCA